MPDSLQGIGIDIIEIKSITALEVEGFPFRPAQMGGDEVIDFSVLHHTGNTSKKLETFTGRTTNPSTLAAL